MAACRIWLLARQTINSCMRVIFSICVTFNSRLRSAKFRARNVDCGIKRGGGRWPASYLSPETHAASVFLQKRKSFVSVSFFPTGNRHFLWWAILSFIFMMSDCLRSPSASFPATFYFHDKSSEIFALIRIRVLSTLSYSLVSISSNFFVCAMTSVTITPFAKYDFEKFASMGLALLHYNPLNGPIAKSLSRGKDKESAEWNSHASFTLDDAPRTIRN